MDLLEEFSFDSLLDRFDRIGVAYSGGLDSTVLLHLLTTKTFFFSLIWKPYYYKSVSTCICAIQAKRNASKTASIC